MTIKTLLATSLFFVFSAHTALSDDCGNGKKDMAPLLGAVRSQGNIGWCYANTAADLISFKFRNDWKGHEASAIFIALGFNSKQKSSEPGSYIFLDGGDIRASISYAGEFGYSCPRALDGFFVNGGLNLKMKQKLHVAEKIKSLFDKKNQSAADANNYSSFIKELREAQSIISLISDQALEAALKLDINKAVLAIAEEVCKPYHLPMKLDKQDIRRYFADDTEYYDDVLKKRIYNKAPNLLMFLNRQLDDENIVGIDYSMKLISADTKDKDQHASVIVGRRLKENKCQYKIRNSWGKECGYMDGMDFYSHYNKKVECEDGHVWVDQADLLSNLVGIAYIVP